MTELLLKTKFWQCLNYYITSGSQTVIIGLLNEDKLYPMANINNQYLAGRVIQRLQSKAVVITTLVVEQHCVVYKLC